VTDLLFLDYETKSRVDLKKFGVYPYVVCPDFEALMCAWSWNGERVELALSQEECLDMPGLFDDSVIKVAHNAQFERVVTGAIKGMPPGQYLDPEPWFDTAAVAAEQGWPRSLAPLGKALMGEQKDEAGTRLINLFCKPNRKGGWNDYRSHPAQWLEFIDYCEQDVYTLIDVFHRMRGLGGWPTLMERRVFMADQRMNDRGVNIDLWMAKEAVRCAAENAEEQTAEFTELSGVLNPNSNPQMMAWVKERGLGIKNLQAATIEALLETELDPIDRRVLELRSELALVAFKKFQAAVSGISPDGRLRGQFRFYGAHTGRWSGRGVQLQNLPRAGLGSTLEVDEAILTLKLGERVDPQTLKCLVRPLLVGPFTVFDYSAIEARVIAWLAGEQWALDAFRAGRDIYVETAERMSTPTKTLTRSHGKVAVLALGFAGGYNSLINMGFDGTKEEGVLLVNQWRKANPNIQLFWSLMDDAIAAGGMVGQYIKVSHTRNHRGTTMHIQLPSGRSLNYHGVKWQRYRVEDPKVPGRMISKEGWTYLNPGGNGYIGTYGGKLTENVVQAVARDIMAEAMVALEENGFDVVGTVHDELIIEGEKDLSYIHDIMCTPPSWATDMPINAEGGHLKRYSK
jgi:DNA polymerase bacteriophage-type